MCTLGLAIVLALQWTEVPAELQESCTHGADPGLPSTQTRSMIQLGGHSAQAMARGEASRAGANAGVLVGAVRRMASAGRGHADLERRQQEANALLSTLGALQADPNDNGINTTELDIIKETLNKALFDNLKLQSAEDQAEVNADHGYLIQCETDMNSSLSGTVSAAFTALGASRKGHKDCRKNESAAYMANSTAWAAYSVLETQIPDPPTCPQFTRKLDSMSNFFKPQSNAMLKWYEDYKPTFRAKEVTYEDADQTLQTERTKCNGLQQAMEQDYCDYQKKLTSTCGTYVSCHQTNLARYRASKARVKQTEASRKSLYKSGRAIICHLEALIAGSTRHDCANSSANLDVSHLAIDYPVEPAQLSCDTSSVSDSPCDASWIAAEYSRMPQGTVAAACSRCHSVTQA